SLQLLVSLPTALFSWFQRFSSFVCFFFFFSSRRRHTRFSRDWSSDVCSSDLSAGAPSGAGGTAATGGGGGGQPSGGASSGGTHRSEERRVGKECRARWSPDH